MAVIFMLLKQGCLLQDFQDQKLSHSENSPYSLVVDTSIWAPKTKRAAYLALMLDCWRHCQSRNYAPLQCSCFRTRREEPGCRSFELRWEMHRWVCNQKRARHLMFRDLHFYSIRLIETSWTKVFDDVGCWRSQRKRSLAMMLEIVWMTPIDLRGLRACRHISVLTGRQRMMLYQTSPGRTDTHSLPSLDLCLYRRSWAPRSRYELTGKSRHRGPWVSLVLWLLLLNLRWNMAQWSCKSLRQLEPGG